MQTDNGLNNVHSSSPSKGSRHDTPESRSTTRVPSSPQTASSIVPSSSTPCRSGKQRSMPLSSPLDAAGTTSTPFLSSDSPPHDPAAAIRQSSTRSPEAQKRKASGDEPTPRPAARRNPMGGRNAARGRTEGGGGMYRRGRGRTGVW